MPWWKLLSLLLKFTGFAQWAYEAYEKHKEWEAKNAANKVLTDSDADVAKQLRDKYTR